jgi:formiminoglutamate deiminase
MELAVNTIFAQNALIGGEWASNVRLTIEHGAVRSIERDAIPAGNDERHRLIVPGMANLHSHAFQRAMAGLTEVRGSASDSFWSWRTLMYKFALSMTPDDIEAVAAQLYMEMLEAGFTRVGEFHYLHHDRDGRHYAKIAEHAERIGAASAATGIGLTLLPVFYARSGFGGTAPTEGQRRFINSVESFSRLMEECRKIISALPGGQLGIAPHSLRAATPEELQAVLPMAGGGPIHIHIAEQTKEVEDCIAWSGARPVEWLLANMPVDERWCFIHATHMTDAETRDMARRGAIAGLCPITEANLGDGIFPAPTFLEAGGHFGVGSDSNISISVAHELRQLEYSQRLGLRSRNVVALPQQSTGARLFLEALKGGARALQSQDDIVSGASADFVSLDLGAAPYLSANQVLDQWIFADAIKVDCVWAAGAKLVAGGRHVSRETIVPRFQAVMAALLDAG